MRETWSAAATGAIAALSGLAAAHLLAGAVAPDASPVVVVGDVVVEVVPSAVKNWAVAAFGTADKPLLLAGIVLAACLLGAVLSVAARRRPWHALAALLLAGTVVLSGLVARAALGGGGQLDAAVALVSVAVGYGVWVLLARRERAAVDPAGRRAFVALAGATAVLGALAAYAGQRLVTAAESVRHLVLPAPLRPTVPLPRGLDEVAPELYPAGPRGIEGLSPLAVPQHDLYRIDTALLVPVVDPDTWRLEIDGDVATRLSLTLGDLLALPVVERDITLVCVSNEVGGRYAGGGRWLGVRTRDVLARAGVRRGVEQFLSTDVQGMTISIPAQALLDDRDALFAIAYNGEQLTREHGFPVRLVTPRLYGYVGSTKWVTRLTATTYGAAPAYWTVRGWDTDAPLLACARIDVPAHGTRLAAGTVTPIAGVSWGGAESGGIARVEVRIDDGPWQAARWGPDAGVDLWRQWFVPWTPDAGDHTVTVRAVDGRGRVQIEEPRPPYPGASTGWHSIDVSAG